MILFKMFNKTFIITRKTNATTNTLLCLQLLCFTVANQSVQEFIIYMIVKFLVSFQLILSTSTSILSCLV